MSSTKTPETIRLLEQQLDVPCKYGNWWIARELLVRQWLGKPEVIRDTTTDLRDLPFMRAAYDLDHRRVLEPYMIGWTVHHFDKHWAYGAACRSVKLGIGDPVHLIDQGDGTEITAGLPGIYRVSWGLWNDESTFNGVKFPHIIDPRQEWITNDLLEYARSHGIGIKIHEAYLFENYTRILDKWAEKIWNARQYFHDQQGPPSLKEANDAAYWEMKDIALKGVGSFATSKDKHAGIDLIHPNWWADVVNKARVNVLANIEKCGMAPLLIEVDGLYFVTRDTNWRTAVPGLNLTPGKLGAYKHEGSCTLTEELYAQANALSAGKLAELFKIAGGEK